MALREGETKRGGLIMKTTYTFKGYKQLSKKEVNKIYAFIDRFFIWDYRSQDNCFFMNTDSLITISVHNYRWTTLSISKGGNNIYHKDVTSFMEINEFKRLVKLIGSLQS